MKGSRESEWTGAKVLESSIHDIIWGIDDSKVALDLAVVHDSLPFFDEVCAGAKHHHWWKGGLVQHVKEIIGWMIDEVDRGGPGVYGDITMTDMVVVALLHDLDKVWSYVWISDEERAKDPGKYHEKQVFKSTSDDLAKILDGTTRVFMYCANKGLIPTARQWSAVLFAHGGYSPANFSYGGVTKVGDTVMHENKLAVLMHMADMYSSQILGKCIA